MLELTRVDGAGLVVDHEVAYGLATVPRRVRRLKETIFEILLTGPGSWLLRHDGIGLMDVTYGSPKVPSRRMTRSTFDMIAQRVFRDHPLNSDLLWSMAVGVADAEHGTMLVVSRSAADEAERLGAQALRVDPSRLDMASLKSATAVDGAILLDPLGNTHAIGVILDGQAGTGGSPARGARYNSAVRYLNAHSDAMVVLVSEDGMINLLPEVMPQVSRASVQEVIGNLEAAVRQPTERRKFGKVLETVRRYKFYLSQDQCDRINELVEIDTADRMRDGMPVFIGPSFAPDSAMDESYFDD